MNCTYKAITVDEILEDREKSWKIRLGGTTAFFGKSVFTLEDEPNTFTGPSWIINKVIQKADELLIKAA